MRWFVVAIMGILASGAVSGSEPVAVSMPVTEAPAPIVVRDLAAAPASISALSVKVTPEIKPAPKLKVASKSKIKKSMLSRSARNQLVLLAAKPTAKVKISLAFLDGDDVDTGADDLDFHRSFSRPKPVKVGDSDDEDDPMISDHVRVRLFLARMKAVEAHAMAQAAVQADEDDGGGLSDTVKLRLLMARMAAVQAHQKKYS